MWKADAEVLAGPEQTASGHPGRLCGRRASRPVGRILCTRHVVDESRESRVPAEEQGDPFQLIDSLFQDWFGDSLAGKSPPGGHRLWGYKLVRSDRCAGGELRWPDQDETLVETELSDGYLGGVTSPGMLAITREAANVALTSAVGGSVLLTVAYNPEDILDAQDTGLLLVRRAYVADADLAAARLRDFGGEGSIPMAMRCPDCGGLLAMGRPGRPATSAHPV